MIASGSLDRTIELQRATTEVNPAGTATDVWTTFAKLRAAVLQQTATEYLRDSGSRVETVVVFRTRYFASVLASDRIRFDGRSFNIREIVPLGRRRGLELRASELS